MSEIKIKVVAKEKPFMYILGDTIHTSYGYLSSTSDNHLQASINHEIGHTVFEKWQLLFLFSFGASWVMLSLLVHDMFLFVWMVYLVFCWVARFGEYRADEFALMLDPTGVDELLMAEGRRMDCWWIDYSPVYFLRWHPNFERRKKRLERIIRRRTDERNRT